MIPALPGAPLKSAVSRALTRVGVAAAASVVVVTGFASPAFADDGADLSINFTGTTIAPFSDGKFGKVTIRNDGPGTATGVVVKFDVSALDDSKVDLDPGSCAVAGDEVSCSIPDAFSPPPGGELEYGIPLEPEAGASGAAGSLTASVESATADPNAGNNSKTVNVNVGDHGVDLLVVAFDVYDADGVSPVPLGGTSQVNGIIINFGDMAAAGIKIVVTLPEHVTFAETEPDCTYSADNRVATCLYDDITLFPNPFPPANDDYLEVFWPVRVAADAPGPAALQGGLMTVSAIDILQPEGPEVRSPLPRTMRWITPDAIPDVDPTDNEDPFAVFIAGDLPVTGFRTGLYALSGVGLLILGALIVVLARRRRRPVTVA
jgi:LPXTG-motif cell wall-anchored protein